MSIGAVLAALGLAVGVAHVGEGAVRRQRGATSEHGATCSLNAKSPPRPEPGGQKCGARYLLIR